MKDLSLFFSELDNEPYRMIFAEAERIWDPLKNIDYILQSLIQNIFIKGSFSSKLEGVCLDQTGKGIFVQKWVKLDQAVYLKNQDIFIGKGTRLEPSVILKGPAVIGENCDLRQGAYVR